MEASLEAAHKRGLLRPTLRPADTAVLLLGAVTETALAIAHAANPAATSRRLTREIDSHVEALCGR
jgi:hypothetical protein